MAATHAKEQESIGLDDKEMDYIYSNKGDEEHKGEVVQEDEEENSPIEEVASVVPNTDDPSLPVNTFRVWFLGFIFSSFFAFINMFFWFREQPIVMTPLVVQLVTYPLGRLLEKIIPSSPFFNPGRFNMKEHVLIVAMVNACYSTAYAIDIVTVQKLWYNQDLGWVGGFLLVLSTQCLGYGLAGVLRPYLVYPAAMVWPTNLVNVAMFRSFHIPEKNTGITRIKWFLVVAGTMFVWYWIPGYFVAILSVFSWACWIAPENVILAQLTGGSQGLSMLAMTFDWSVVTSFLGSPLVVPWWVHCNVLAGFVLVAWIIAPALYYNNVWNSKAYPILTASLFTVDGEAYDKSRILNADITLNETLYQEYGPLRLSSFFAVTYGVGFASLTAILTHAILWNGKQIVAQWKASREENEDIHAKLMRKYPEVPGWWYYSIFLGSLAVGFIIIYVWPINMPWWGLLLAVFICCIFVLPIGIITAVTNQTPGLNVITEFVIGLALPGHPIANVTFKTYGYISMTQALTFVGDLKLGHYMKIPPRAMFNVQLFGTLIACIINLATARWLYTNVENICTPKGYPWTCRNAKTFYSASVIWGVIGPAKMFGGESPYSVVLWFFLIGAVLPIPFYFLAKRYPNSFFKHVHMPVLLSATGFMPPASPVNYTSWVFVGFVFMFYLRKYHAAWWAKYNYITSAALDSGLAVSTLVVFAVSSAIPPPVWWGNGQADINATPDNCPLALANATGVCVYYQEGFDMVTSNPKADVYLDQYKRDQYEQYQNQYAKQYNTTPPEPQPYATDQTEYHSFEQDEEENSPIEEVRATVPNTDNPSLPVMTFRFWFLGILFTAALSFVNQFFWFRDSPITLTPLVLQLFSYPLGRLLERVIPSHPFFNPGPFNMKVNSMRMFPKFPWIRPENCRDSY
ncbi:hypothetical protein BC938DRAFT_483292 [Jimgerdemannia flammicorona]|uniref:OPT family small oligopeptide transporter n=1 Tax=Jimgerdemannia flammicorona TaxID=994334 RepID=A0A433QC80_9FUNG|nr:hypothetical protein BC938DRAFT_483292 [Jimgerdemannia flammicorona]